MAACRQGCNHSTCDSGARSFKTISYVRSGNHNAIDRHLTTDSSDEEQLQTMNKNATVLNVVADIMQIGRENVLSFSSVDASFASETPGMVERGGEGRPVLREHWIPKGRLSVVRTRSGFPDCHDHLVQLLVCKNQQTREVLDIGDKYEVTVKVSYDGAGGTSTSASKIPDYQCERIKNETKSATAANRSMIGVVGFLFRSHEPNTKYKITFSLKTIPPKKKGKKGGEEKYTMCETISEISVKLETGVAASSKSGRMRKTREAKIVSPSCALSPAPLSKEDMILCKRSSWVVNQLQSRRENAKWSDFDKYANDLCLAFSDADTQISIKLELSVGACYQNELECALQLIDESFSMVPKAKNPHLLLARGYGYRAGILRKQGRLGLAEDSVQLAEQNVSACQTSLDTSLIAYERASVLIDFTRRTPHRSLTQMNEALRNLEKCIDVCERVESKNSDLSVIKHHFVLVLVKMTMLLLNCSTDGAREGAVSDEFITRAQACLDTLRIRYWSDMAPGDRVAFYLANSDLEYRRSNFAEGEEFASLAKEMATEIGYNMAISLAQGRLDHLRRLTCRHAVDIQTSLPTSESEGENGDVSSTASESDCLRQTLN